MQLNMSTLSGRTTLLFVTPITTIAQVKNLVESKKASHPDDYRLFSTDRQLQDEKTLTEHNLRHYSILHLYLQLDQEMQVFVKTLTGKTIVIWSTPLSTVEALKIKIREKEGVPVAQQRLVFDGKQLENEREFAECGIKNEGTSWLVFWLLGCGCGCAEKTTAEYLTVRVKTPKGPVVLVGLLSTDPIDRLKAMVEAQGGWPAGCQVLVLVGETLRVGTTVGNYEFDGSIVEKMRRVGHRGGVCAPAGGASLLLLCDVVACADIGGTDRKRGAK